MDSQSKTASIWQLARLVGIEAHCIQASSDYLAANELVSIALVQAVEAF